MLKLGITVSFEITEGHTLDINTHGKLFYFSYRQSQTTDHIGPWVRIKINVKSNKIPFADPSHIISA